MPLSPTRRQLFTGAGALAALGVVGGGGLAVHRALRPDVDPRTRIGLWSATVAYDAEGQRVLVGGRAADQDLAPGTRLTADHPDGFPAQRRAEEFWEGTAAWRADLPAAAGDGATATQLSDLAESALLDLWVLSDGLPAPVAGWSESWRYIWPRDAAFCAVALAKVGQLERAVGILEHLQSLQSDDGWFEARYRPDAATAPDARPRQFDGTGLLLWAAVEVIEAAEAPQSGGPAGSGDTAGSGDAAGSGDTDGSSGASAGNDVRSRLAPLLTTSHTALLDATRGGTELPPASPDYWELRERAVTLGIMTATLTGLRSASRLLGTPEARDAAEALTTLFEETFGANGHQRYRRSGGADSARAFLDATGCHDVMPRERLLSLRTELARPAGGIAPGASWRQDGVSWTPSTSLLGLALARAGEDRSARKILCWLAAHRTGAGSFPEKVLFDGRPAEVAPLAWTAANVLLTLDALARP